MIFEVGLLAKSPVADVALEGPCPRVDVGVRLEISGSWERFGAHCALVRLLLEKRGKKDNQFICLPKALLRSHIYRSTIEAVLPVPIVSIT